MLNVHWSLIIQAGVTAILGTLAFLVYRQFPAGCKQLAGGFDAHCSEGRLGRALCILVAALLPVMLRLALLPLAPPPEPVIHDEFSHLLVADTLLHGRLANPTHPLWRHLETIYVLQQPTYSSIYPIGNGIALAAGEVVFGHPWAGVLLGVMLMSGATSWMLFGCLPPRWAAYGGILVGLNYGLASGWADSYYGGAFCAFGGALLFGALCRIRVTPSVGMALVAALGWSIVWLIRPFEAAILLLMYWGLLTGFAINDKRRWPSDSAWRRRWLRLLGLTLLVEMLAGGVTAVHNQAVTGSYLKMPYQLSREAYGVPQSFLGQPPVPEPAGLEFRELKEMYEFQRQAKDQSIVRYAVYVIDQVYLVFVGRWCLLPLGMLVLVKRDPLVIAGALIVASAIAMSLLYSYFGAHYLAAYTCLFAFLILRGFQVLFRFAPGGRSLLRAAGVFLMIGGVLHSLQAWLERPRVRLRASVIERLQHLGGQHVVFIKYGPNHSLHREWVYNAADIDASSIVWCRAIDPVHDAEVKNYYKARRYWILEVDQNAVQVSSYANPGAVQGGFERQGITGGQMKPSLAHYTTRMK